MTSRSSIIASFVVLSLVVGAGVELFCQKAGSLLSVGQTEGVAVANKKGTAPLKQKVKSTSPVAKKSTAKVNENYSVIAQRSLFGKPKPVEVVAVKEKVDEPLKETSLNLILRGTVSGAGDVQRAIIQDKVKKTQDLYYKGDAIGSVIVKEVKRGEVILTVNGKDEILRMADLKSTPRGKKAGSAMNAKGGPAPKSVVDSIQKAVDKRRKNKPKTTSSVYPRRRLTFKSAPKQETDK